LSENEDDSEFARTVYRENFKLAGNIADINHIPAQATKLMVFKSQWLTDFTIELAKILRCYQPELKTARNLYAPALLNPISERWLSQNYQNFITNYDYTVVMAMPYMENVDNPKVWFKSLVQNAKSNQYGLQKTVFELQAKDWKRGESINAGTLKQQMQTLTEAGANHIGYYPDDFLKNRPEMETIRPYISSRGFPYLPNVK